MRNHTARIRVFAIIATIAVATLAVATLAVATLAVATLAVACNGGSNTVTTPTTIPMSDPAARGPYAVGLTRITFERTSNADGSPRPLDTWIWYPAKGEASTPVTDDAAPLTDRGPFPVVIFSHGSGGQPQFQRFLTEHLASWGFVVAAPPHPGNTSANCILCDIQNVIASARERPDDVTAVLDQLIALRGDPSQPLGTIIDPERAAIAGHSFGGWTSLFVAPGGRFDAAIALAPGQPETLLKRVAGIRVPVMIISGGKDAIVSPASVEKLWRALPNDIDKTYVSFPEAGHLTFIDRCFGCTDALPEARGHALTNGYVTAFLMTHLYGDTRYDAYITQPQPPDAVLVPPS